MASKLFTAQSIEAMTTKTVIGHHGIQRSYLPDTVCLRRVHALIAELQRRAGRGDTEAQQWIADYYRPRHHY